MPDNIRVTMLPALNGDSFLISCGTGEDKRNILVDGGMKSTFRDQLCPLLTSMHQKGEVIDLLIVTHIDQDHIHGVIELLTHNESSEAPAIIGIKEIWHNSYLQLQMDKADELTDHQQRVLEEIVARGDGSREDANAKGEISFRQGSTLGALLYEGRYNWNGSAGGRAVTTQSLPVHHLSDELKLELLSPTPEKLQELGQDWLNHLRKNNYIGAPSSDRLFDDAYEMMLRRLKDKSKPKKQPIHSPVRDWELYKEEPYSEDDRATNGSSIAFVLTYRGKRLLYLGDSHPTVIVEGLASLYQEEQRPYEFSAVKISHHGSSGNTSPELLAMIDSPLYLVSTNGSQHGHPECSTLIRIVNRDSRYERELVFNYPHDSAAFMDEQQDKKTELDYKVTIATDIELKRGVCSI
ncbi:AVAST type 1 anti-phage system MBL fold metallo-hydrolase Avs1a [Cohnella faecalis]|nr:AVAST type 1 anti-phage system MBL fold metallo-hydrolase Avs1a [Cohnella faecalis]